MMDKDSKNDSIREMEQIQKGLEEFLNKEVLNQENINYENAASDTVNIIEQGTEDMNTGNRGIRREPQFFTIGEEDEAEKEIEIIGTTNKNSNTKIRSTEEEDYVEDWDSKEHRRRIVEQPERTEGKNSGIKKKLGQSEKKNKEEIEEVQEKPRRSKKKKKKKSKFKRFLATVAVLAVLIFVGLYYVVGVVYAKMNYSEIESVAEEPMKEEGVTNILLIGNDSRENGEDGRSDAMILVSISDKTKKIYMTSLLRDMYVEIPGYKGNRLNAAYSYGGAELLMETVEQNLDISINRYVLVNFEAFAKLVDAVGGIELELTSEEIEYVNGYLVEYNMLTDRPQGTDNMDTSVSGLVHLNGPQALAYSRNRYLGTDFGRTERQRKVLAAVIQKAPKALISNPKELINGLLPNLTTNLTQNETYSLSLTAPKILTYEIVQSSIPIEGTYQNASIRGMSVLEVDFEANKQYIRENIYGEEAITE